LKEFLSKLTWVDYLAALAVLRGIYVGFRSGFFPELLRLASYLVTALVTFRFYEEASQYLTLHTFLNSTTATAVAVVVLLGSTLLATKLLTMLILKLLKIGEGGFFVRVIGAAMGGCRWLVLLSLIFMLIDRSPLSGLKSDVHRNSVSGQRIYDIAPTLFGFLSSVSPKLGLPPSALPAK
jgi:uncharacterized membrane protein required for colicin V production